MPPASPRRILVVDDSPAARTVLANLAAPYGFEVDEAGDGAEGLRRLVSRRYALVFLDMQMPVFDGPGLLRLVRARGDPTPVVLVTGVSTTRDLAAAVRLGVAGVLVKPYDPATVHPLLEAAAAGG